MVVYCDPVTISQIYYKKGGSNYFYTFLRFNSWDSQKYYQKGGCHLFTIFLPYLQSFYDLDNETVKRNSDL